MQGFKFGFIDNSIVAIFAILGINIDKYFNQSGTFWCFIWCTILVIPLVISLLDTLTLDPLLLLTWV